MDSFEDILDTEQALEASRQLAANKRATGPCLYLVLLFKKKLFRDNYNPKILLYGQSVDQLNFSGVSRCNHLYQHLGCVVANTNVVELLNDYCKAILFPAAFCCCFSSRRK